MIPILYSGTETEYRSNGLGRLNEIVSCKVTEERNGIYELEFEYPVTGRFYQQMVSMVEAYSTGNQSLMGTVACIHDDKHDIQPFDLYAVSAPIDGIATFNAHHVSYRLGTMVVAPFTASNASDAMTQIPLKIAGPNNFTFWTDKGTGGSFELENPEAVRNILGGQEGSLLDVFGTGEYEFDKFTVKLYQNRNQGFDSGVTIRYGKNLTDFERELDSSGHFNAIAPYWKGQIMDEETSESQDVVVYLLGLYVQSPEVSGTPVVAAIDFSSEFREMPTQDELRARALKYLSDNKPWLPDDNVKISFVQLWQTTEYADIAALQRLSLCDIVNVYYPELGIIAERQKIIKVTYNVLLERYDEMELGKPTTSLASSISSDARANFESELEQAKKNALTSSQMQAAIAHATELITGGLGGYVVFTQNADGEPQEILIMDTDDVNTAVHVIRINQNGIGFSSNGYQGPFTSAWTIDGSFNADFITAGSISASMLSGGILKLGGANNGNGVMRVYDAGDYEMATLDNAGFMSRSGLFDRYDQPIYRFGNAQGHRYSIDLVHGNIIFSSIDETYDSSGKLQSQEKVERLKISTSLYLWHPAVDILSNYEIQISYPPRFRILTKNSDTGSSGDFDFRPGIVEFHTEDKPNNETANYFFQAIKCTLGANTTVTGGLYVNGIFNAAGGKHRIVKTSSYGTRVLTCYEMPSPMFGDIGSGVIGADGKCVIYLDEIFQETIDNNIAYYVFLQKNGEGDCWVSERNPNYFVVCGTPGLSFSWELKAKQFDHADKRLEEYEFDFDFKADGVIDRKDYGSAAANYIKELEEGRMAI